MARKPKLDRFHERVLSKYQIYSNLFLSLPFDTINETGVLLSLFSNHCTQSYAAAKDPASIVEDFFERYAPEYSETERHDMLFRFIQYIERQVVLFDAIEDAAFPYVNNMHGRGTLRAIKEEAQERQMTKELQHYLNTFTTRIVLTAHPTQFYPDRVLGIINDLAKAVASDDLEQIKLLLTQLGKTRFYNEKKPTPFDEARSLVWFLENVFYHAAATIHSYVNQQVYQGDFAHSLIELGFWPGGDRDGNPFVTAETTLKTAAHLRFSVLRNYYRDLRNLKRRITFDDADTIIAQLTDRVFEAMIGTTTSPSITAAEINAALEKVKAIVVEEHEGLFVNHINDMILKVRLFGTHFACLDIRQDSRVHQTVWETLLDHLNAKNNTIPTAAAYNALSPEEQIEFLSNLNDTIQAEELPAESIARSTVESVYAMQHIQKTNGEKGCNRYIISNCQSVVNVLQVLALCKLCHWEEPTVDVIPLFETVPDLEAAEAVMKTLYEHPIYRAHLEARGKKQTVMLGFSDGTKDGGYFMANWSIYKCKEVLSVLSENYGISIAFFDGRGGPPARGGGNTHQFYAAMGEPIKVNDIQLTIQGQTISSNFGTLDSCQYNLEQLISSGIQSQVFQQHQQQLTAHQRELMERIAQKSHAAYTAFKAHPQFVPYLQEMTTLPYYAKTNIGSRPAKRGTTTEFRFEDLRAIPFVGSWSQSKQNVPGFYGLGTALEALQKEGEFAAVQELYRSSKFFRTLVANSMMSLTKSFFQLTAYIKDDPTFGSFWENIHQEYQRTHKLLLALTNFEQLMQNEPAGKASIAVREAIVQPLLTVQQYALMQINALKKQKGSAKKIAVLEKIVTRSMFGNINASRNSA